MSSSNSDDSKSALAIITTDQDAVKGDLDIAGGRELHFNQAAFVRQLSN